MMKNVWTVYTAVPLGDMWALARTRWTDEGPGATEISRERYQHKVDAERAAKARQDDYDSMRKAMA